MATFCQQFLSLLVVKFFKSLKILFRIPPRHNNKPLTETIFCFIYYYYYNFHAINLYMAEWQFISGHYYHSRLYPCVPFSVLYTAMILEASSSIVSLFHTAYRIYFVSIIGGIWQVKMQIWRKNRRFWWLKFAYVRKK